MRSSIIWALGWFAFWAAGGVSAVAADGTSASASGPLKYTLRYHFQPGEVLRWEVLQQSATTACAVRRNTPTDGSNVSPRTVQSSETVTRSTKVWRIKDVDAKGVATFENLVEDMQSKATISEDGKTNTVRYNSRTDKPVPPYETVAASLGKVLSVIRIDPQGNVLSRKRMPIPGNAPNEGRITIPLPAEAVPIGHVWTSEYQMNVPLPNKTIKRVQLRQKFVLQNVQTGVATIAVSNQILTPIDHPFLESELAQAESSGLIKFDIDAGRVIEQQIDRDKRVVGALGGGSSTHYLSRFTEKILR